MYNKLKNVSFFCVCLLAISPAGAQQQVLNSSMTATTTIPSVGHRPSTPYSEINAHSTVTGHTSSMMSGMTMFPGMRTSPGDRKINYDPDVQTYQGKENLITTCFFNFIDKNNNVSPALTIRKKPCNREDLRVNIEKKHVGHKLSLTLINETDPNSVTDYTPVPLVSLQDPPFETGYISDTPSPANSIVDIDKNVLSVGETATIKIIFKDVNGNHLEYMGGSLLPGTILPGWKASSMTPTGQPGEYTSTVTYEGGPGSVQTFNPEWTYLGEKLHEKITLTGTP
ncbi:hypothetical protein LRN22_004275 [Salmonella enterica]|nr:hypothetical protein [Salmonella enterica]EME7695724.1 hypothetical protein [Salmonella enterica]